MTRIENSLAPWQVALARHHAYSLFGQLYLQGITASLLSYLEAVPELAQFAGANMDLDLAGAEYQHLFGLNLFPFESIYLDTTGMLGGQLSEAVLRSFRQAGYDPHLATSSPDHVGHELGLLAYLCQTEAECWQRDDASAAGQIQQQQWLFLRDHLLRWLLPLLISIRQHDSSFFTALADLTEDLICSHYLELEHAYGRPEFTAELALPALPMLLEDEQTGLREIAAYLLTPAYCGAFLSGDNISTLAREQELPRGFGGRQQLLLNLMRNAVQYNAFPSVLNALIDRFGHWQRQYHNWAHRVPPLASIANAWASRTAQTVQLLHQMEAHAPHLE